jgi:hypothetical protein
MRCYSHNDTLCGLTHKTIETDISCLYQLNSVTLIWNFCHCGPHNMFQATTSSPRYYEYLRTRTEYVKWHTHRHNITIWGYVSERKKNAGEKTANSLAWNETLKYQKFKSLGLNNFLKFCHSTLNHSARVFLNTHAKKAWRKWHNARASEYALLTKYCYCS